MRRRRAPRFNLRELALWECSRCGRFSTFGDLIDPALEWLDRVAPLSSMPRVPSEP